MRCSMRETAHSVAPKVLAEVQAAGAAADLAWRWRGCAQAALPLLLLLLRLDAGPGGAQAGLLLSLGGAPDLQSACTHDAVKTGVGPLAASEAPEAGVVCPRGTGKLVALVSAAEDLGTQLEVQDCQGEILGLAFMRGSPAARRSTWSLRRISYTTRITLEFERQAVSRKQSALQAESTPPSSLAPKASHAVVGFLRSNAPDGRPAPFLCP